MGYLSWRSRKLRKRAVRMMCSRLYRDPDGGVENTMMVAGAGRSGTTWLGDIIASQKSCRVMFEPFNSHQVPGFAPFRYFHYVRPGEINDLLYDYCWQVFTGTIRHPWVDRQVDRLRPEYRLIKEIRANLFLKWLHDQFPSVPLLFIIRHPCAVVLSRMQLDWWTDADIEPFLAQQDLLDDFLGARLALIRDARTPEQKHAVIWCVNNLVPLAQFADHELNVVYYENLISQPQQEIPRIFSLLGSSYGGSVYSHVKQPSTTTVRSSAIVRGEDQIAAWQAKLTPRQITDILEIVDGFGLSHLYGEATRPRGGPAA